MKGFVECGIERDGEKNERIFHFVGKRESWKLK